jgi:uncharacterized membrane protein YecN with MAPEG domain
MTTPKITLLFASLHVLLMIVLLARVVRRRRDLKVGIGDGGDELLARRIRVHANFTENVPIALALMALLELSGLLAPWLWSLGGVLLIARVLHSIGLSGSSGNSFGRLWGASLTWVVLAAMALLGTRLSLSTF